MKDLSTMLESALADGDQTTAAEILNTIAEIESIPDLATRDLAARFEEVKCSRGILAKTLATALWREIKYRMEGV